LFVQQEVPQNRIYYNKWFKDRFSHYFNIYGGPDDRDRPYAPFFYLKTSGFWILNPIRGKENQLAKLKNVGSSKDISMIEYASLAPEVFQLFINRDYANAIREYIESILKELRVGQNELPTVNEAPVKYSLFEHEKVAITYLKSHAAIYGKIINNVEIYDKQSNNYYEYDCILVAHSGIYVVELKHWSGRIEIVEYNWLINEAVYRRDPHQLNNFKAKLLKGIYEQQFRTYPNVWAESVVILTNPDAGS